MCIHNPSGASILLSIQPAQRTNATSAEQCRQIDSDECRSLKMREIRSFYTRVFIDSSGMIILTRRRGTIFRLSCRMTKSKGQIHDVREAFNIASNSLIIPFFERQNWVGVVDLSGTRSKINSDATKERVVLLAWKQSEKECSVLTSWPITFCLRATCSHNTRKLKNQEVSRQNEEAEIYSKNLRCFEDNRQ